ncbi:DinB family protein [Flavobacteriaceae bacterium LMO-SS05]
MKYDLFKSIEILERTPIILKEFLSPLSDDWIFCNEGDQTWSAFDSLGHLIHGEKTDWIPRLHIILGHSKHKIFEPFDRFAQFEQSKGKSVQDLLNEFMELRQANLTHLKSLNLTKNQLLLTGIHPELGEVTLSQLLATWVTHDLGHIAQIARVMAKQYKTEVGPWAAYLPILNR